jgi:hypothetical protein
VVVIIGNIFQACRINWKIRLPACAHPKTMVTLVIHHKPLVKAEATLNIVKPDTYILRASRRHDAGLLFALGMSKPC